jgi:predicted MFS family arabinose efflux permease
VLVSVSLGGALLTLVDWLPAMVVALALMAFAMFTVVPICQLLIPRLVTHHRGTATSLHLTVYYLLGGLGAYLPGLALSAGWGDVVAVCLAASAAAFALAGLLAARLPARRPALG